MQHSGRSPGARLPGWWALVPLVLLLHLWLGDRAADAALGLAGAGPDPGMRRMKAVFVVELRPQTPPPVAAAPAPVPRRATPPLAAPAAPAASAAVPAEVAAPEPPRAEVPPDPIPAPAPPAPPAPPLAVAEPEVPAPAPAVAEASPPVASSPAGADAAKEQVFEWPRSTRLSFHLTGNYRGPVDGTASVEWLYDAGRYQVHVEVAVGPSFAPLVSRRMSSDGLAGPDGLRPRLYEEETRTPFRDPRRQRVRFDEESLTLANGTVLPRPAGVQDTASQFVQLTWLFRTQPGLLQPGRTVELPLALPRRVDPWVYDVLPGEVVHTTAGPIETVPVRPRRLSRRSGELSAELWVAPSLQHLPVRIVIRQDEETYVDLLLDRLPQQTAEERLPR